MRKWTLTVAALATLALTIFVAAPGAQAAGVVGDGTAASCTDDALKAALAGGGPVTFNCGGPATILVTGNNIVSADTSIDGGGLITLDGGGNDGLQMFYVNRDVHFSVSNAVLSTGNGEASTPLPCGSNNTPIYSDGAVVTVTNCTFSGNVSGGSSPIYNVEGTVGVTNSTFSDNGSCAASAIYNLSGTVTVANSTFVHNSDGPRSGGYTILDHSGTLTLTNSTFSLNTSTRRGSTIVNVGDGSVVTVTNSTFSLNSNADGGFTVQNVSDPSKGGSLTLTNSILANSSGSNCDHAITDGGHNLDDGTTCGFSAANGSLSNTDPQLDAGGLNDNGGPTQTIALQAGSPAINAGDQTVCAAAPVNNLDQRGSVRPGPGAARCSIGAYESAAPGTPASRPCMGDCSGDGEVTVDEILTMVNMALGGAASACSTGVPLGTCSQNRSLACNSDNDCDPLPGGACLQRNSGVGAANQITIAEILTAVNHVLDGCPVG